LLRVDKPRLLFFSHRFGPDCMCYFIHQSNTLLLMWHSLKQS
jgi:hypothetical protein